MKAILKLSLVVWLLGAGFQGGALAAALSGSTTAGGITTQGISDWDCGRICD